MLLCRNLFDVQSPICYIALIHLNNILKSNTLHSLHQSFNSLCISKVFGAMCAMEIASSLHQMGIDYLYVRILVQ